LIGVYLTKDKPNKDCKVNNLAKPKITIADCLHKLGTKDLQKNLASSRSHSRLRSPLDKPAI